MASHETGDVLRMMRALWPDCDDREVVDDAVFVLDGGSPPLLGFIAIALRPWAEGCTTTPVAYVEGWWVDAAHRGHGWGRALMEAGETWARDVGASELGSDAQLSNAASIAAHHHIGFDEVERVVAFRKPIETRRSPPQRRPEMTHLIGLGGVIASALGAQRPTDAALAALFHHVLFEAQPAGKGGWECWQLGLITDRELINLVLAHLETLLERHGKARDAVTLERAIVECLERVLIGHPIKSD